MNNKNIQTTYADGILTLDWCSHDRNDTEPDESSSHCIIVDVEALGVDDRIAMKKARTILCSQYDKWIDATRGVE
jgi:hypothetical protein